MFAVQILIKYSRYIVFFVIIVLISLMWQSQSALVIADIGTTTGTTGGDGVGGDGTTGATCGNVGVAESTSAI